MLVSFTGEGQEDTTITFKQLKERVTILTSAMKNAGVKKGDRVAGIQIVKLFLILFIAVEIIVIIV